MSGKKVWGWNWICLSHPKCKFNHHGEYFLFDWNDDTPMTDGWMERVDDLKELKGIDNHSFVIGTGYITKYRRNRK